MGTSLTSPVPRPPAAPQPHGLSSAPPPHPCGPDWSTKQSETELTERRSTASRPTRPSREGGTSVRVMQLARRPRDPTGVGRADQVS